MEAKDMKKSIESNVRGIESRVRAAALRAGRDPAEVTVLAAVKNRSAEEIRAAASAGVRVVGENRVQELLDRMREVGDEVEWHFIGHLQRNKARQVAGKVGLIHSLDSVGLAVELDRRAALAGERQPVLVQVNVASEESKSGFDASEVGGALRGILELKSLEVMGFSTIAPLVRDPEEVRWVFRGLRELAEESERLSSGGRWTLSMGMTNDFEVAVEEGATIVRIGTAIFDRG